MGGKEVKNERSERNRSKKGRSAVREKVQYEKVLEDRSIFQQSE